MIKLIKYMEDNHSLAHDSVVDIQRCYIFY